MAISFYFPPVLAPKMGTYVVSGVTGASSYTISISDYDPGFFQSDGENIYLQGYQITKDDLKILFVDDQNRFFTPFAIYYQVGYITAIDGIFHQIGISKRIPIQMRTGILRPNFRIGDKWSVGKYEIRWFYQIVGGDAYLMRTTPFTLCTSGCYDFMQIAPSFFDLSASLTIIP